MKRAPDETLIGCQPLLQQDPGEEESTHQLDCWLGLVFGTACCLATFNETGRLFYSASYDGRHRDAG